MFWTLSWDFFDAIIYTTGLYNVGGTGPNPIQPASGVFDALNSNNSEFFVYLNETYPIPAIWTVSGIGALYRTIFSNPWPQVEYQEDGVVECDAVGAF